MKNIVIAKDKTLLDIDFIHSFLSTSYWASTRSKEENVKAIEHSVCYGVYENSKQIGFARIVTDFAVVTLLCHFFICPTFQNQGIGKLLLKYILEDPAIKGLKLILATKDAEKFYSQFGFTVDGPSHYKRMTRAAAINEQVAP